MPSTIPPQHLVPAAPIDPTRSPGTALEVPEVTTTDPITGLESSVSETEDYKNMFIYEKAREKFDALVKEWESVLKPAAALRRNYRALEIDLESLYASGDLKPDETYIPIRVIDENIRKDHPKFLNYLTASQRLMIFKDIEDPQRPTADLEDQVTEGLRYVGWETAPYRSIDGFSLHGWDSIETEYDESKPLNIGYRQIGNDKLLFPVDARELQFCEFIMIENDVRIPQLDRFVEKFGFDASQVMLLKEQWQNKEIKENIVIYKVLCKFKGIVYVSWACLQKNICTNWLKAPEKLFMGVRSKIMKTVTVPGLDPLSGQPTLLPQQVEEWIDEYETEYPVEVQFYEETEEGIIVKHKGRAHKDKAKQEAQCALWSLYINGAVRASNVYGSPVKESGNGGSPKKLELALEAGCFYSEPMAFWSPPYPSPEILRAADSLDVRTQAEQGRTADAVINRQDARKTAAEMKLANQQESELATTDLVLFQASWRRIFTRSWRFIQSYALQGSVTLLPVQLPPEVLMMNPGAKAPNDVARIGRRYNILAAGDVDVIKRRERIQAKMALLEAVAQTPIGPKFLLNLIRDMLPEEHAEYMTIMQQAMMAQQQAAMMQQSQQAAPAAAPQ